MDYSVWFRELITCCIYMSYIGGIAFQSMHGERGSKSFFKGEGGGGGDTRGFYMKNRKITTIKL